MMDMRHALYYLRWPRLASVPESQQERMLLLMENQSSSPRDYSCISIWALPLERENCLRS